MVDMKSCSISGPPSRLRQLKSNVKLLEKAFDQIPPVTGFWNAFHVYGEDQVSEVLETRLSALDKLAAPCRAILSPSTGELIQPLSSSLLFTRAVDDLLRRRVLCKALQQTMSEHIQSKSVASNQIISFGVNPNPETPFITRRGETQITIERNDISNWCSSGASLKPQGRFYHSNIAVVGMSGRFPGNYSSKIAICTKKFPKTGLTWRRTLTPAARGSMPVTRLTAVLLRSLVFSTHAFLVCLLGRPLKLTQCIAQLL